MLNVTSSKFGDNRAKRHGAGIMGSANGKVHVSDSVFDSNSASDSGVAIHAFDCEMIVDDCRFSRNQICNLSTIFDEGNCGNERDRAVGSSDDSKFELNNCTFYN